MKISIIGAGNVGSMLAERILAHNLSDVVLLDIVEGLARGKALDLLDASFVFGYKKRITGTADYKETKNSDVVVVTAGLPRKPGMSREDLLNKNSAIIKSVTKDVKEFSPEAILVIVTNPLDVMTYLAYKESGFKKNKVFGMAGNLDASRFKALLYEELGVRPDKIETYVLGSHGDTMVPLVSRTRICGKGLTKFLSKAAIEKVLERTKKRGGEIVALLKSGSAHFSPSAACFDILKSVASDAKKTIPCSCIMTGEYGITDCAIGVPAIIGKNGVEEILKWDLAENEKEALLYSAKKVRETLNKLGGAENARSKQA